jgi:hydrogenase 3 maturation protease
MSSKSWQETLQLVLSRKHKRQAIVGVGHELRGDDAVGVAVIRELQQHYPNSENILLVDAGAAPENITGVIRRFMPDTVLLIDAVDMKQAPGSIEWIDWHNIGEGAASTHTLSLHLFTDYMQSEFDCDVLLLGIQPAQTAFDSRLTASVQASVFAIVQVFHDALSPNVTSVMDES